VKTWQRGYDLGLLRLLAMLFAQHDEGMIHGAFGTYRETAAAADLERGALRIAWADDEPVAAVIAGSPGRGLRFTDFRGYGLALRPGLDSVRRMAWAPGYDGAVLEWLQSAGRPLAVETWQEHPGERALVAALGLDLAAVKISAASEVRGLWTAPGLLDHAPGYVPEEALALGRLPLDLEAEAVALLAEVDAAALAWAQHYSSYNQRGAWTALALRGYADDPAFVIKPAEMSHGWQEQHEETLAAPIRDTPLRAALPAAEPVMAALPVGELHRVRLMQLAPGGGELTRHADITDRDAGVADGKLVRLHVPLRTNPDCVFSSWTLDGARQRFTMPAGSCCYLDTRKPHTATNHGMTARVHLVVDAEATADTRAALAQAAAEPPALTAVQVAPISAPAPVKWEGGGG
jgi:hypothetical protein